MLTRLMVDLYAWIIEISLWFMVLIAGIVGYDRTVPVLQAAGAIIEHEAAWKISGAVFFVIVVLCAATVVVGPMLVLLDIRKAVKAFETRNGGGSTGSSSSGGTGTTRSSSPASSSKGRRMPVELKEPSL